MICKCTTALGHPCTRTAVSGSSYCWQHQTCGGNGSGVKPKGPAAIIKHIGQQRNLVTIKPGTLTVSAYANFYPVCYKERGVLKGLDVDLMKEFAKLTGLALVFIEKPVFNGIWLDPVNGISDISIGGIGMSKERTTIATEWSIPYFYVARSFIFNKRNPVNSLKNISKTVRATVGSTGYLDAKLRLDKVGKGNLLESGKTDADDIQDLLDGKIQGLLRGSFVAKSIVKHFPDQLGMIKPWHIDSSLVASDGEVFAYPTNKSSGIAVILTMMLTKDIMNKHLSHLQEKYDLD